MVSSKKELWKQYYQKNRERLLKYQKLYRGKYPEREKAKRKKYRQKNLEALRLKSRLEYRENLLHHLKRAKNYRLNYPDRVKARYYKWAKSPKGKATLYAKAKRSYRKLKSSIVGHYSNGMMECKGYPEGKCMFKEKRLFLLQLDHIADNGSAERRALFGKNHGNGIQFFNYLIKNNYPAGYQVLCIICNMLKERDRKIRQNEQATI